MYNLSIVLSIGDVLVSDILAKNLKSILEYNPLLCAKILGVNSFSKSIELAQNSNGEHNLVVEGVPVHSVNCAIDEAKNILSTLPHNNYGSIHVIYGLGLGYLCDVFVQNVKGSVIVFEPDIEVLRYVLEIVDFADSFSTKRCFFVSDYAEYSKVFSDVYKYRSKTSLSVLDYHFSQYKLVFENLKKEVERQYGLVSHNYSFQVNSIYHFLLNTLGALDHKVSSQLLTDYSGVLSGKPAIIVSAGPSLAKNIEFLKKYKDNVVIFCVGTALKTLLKNGIVPDFLNVIERSNTSIHYNMPETAQMMLICEAYTNYTVYEQKFSRVFVTASEETEASRWFLDKISKPLVPFETKGTVAYHALFSAKTLGCNPIILIGQDLAYSDGNCYAKGSVFDDLKCVFDENEQRYKIIAENFERFRDSYYHSPLVDIDTKNQAMTALLDKFNRELVTVDGQNGEKLPTSAVYSLFIEYLKDFATRFNKSFKLVNSSSGGAMIDGFDNMPLADALNAFASNNIDKSELFSAFKSDENVDLGPIIDSLKVEVNYVSRILPMLDEGIALANSFKKELNRAKIFTDNADKILTKMTNLYVQITNDYMIHSKMLGMVFMKERSELAYLMNEYDGIFDKDMLRAFSETFYSYFNNTRAKFDVVVGALNYLIGNLERRNNESCYTKG